MKTATGSDRWTMGTAVTAWWTCPCENNVMAHSWSGSQASGWINSCRAGQVARRERPKTRKAQKAAPAIFVALTRPKCGRGRCNSFAMCHTLEDWASGFSTPFHCIRSWKNCAALVASTVTVCVESAATGGADTGVHRPDATSLAESKTKFVTEEGQESSA